MVATETRSRAARAVRRHYLALVAVALAALIAAPSAGAPYAQGEEVLFTGIVTKSDGTPIPDLQVTLEASRAAFSFRRLGRVRENLSRLATTTNARGEFSIPWPWDDYYNRFELVVSLPWRTTSGDTAIELRRVDLSRRATQGSPVVSTIEVADAARVEARGEFLAALDSADKRKTYEQMGIPERLERLELGRSAEVTWWYFEHGRAYRFRDGTLRQVLQFDPVEPFAP